VVALIDRVSLPTATCAIPHHLPFFFLASFALVTREDGLGTPHFPHAVSTIYIYNSYIFEFVSSNCLLFQEKKNSISFVPH